MYEVQLTGRAQHEYDRLLFQEQARIDIILDQISANPRPPGTRKISGNVFRVRTGNWRVIYAVYDKSTLVLVGRITRRAEDTYDNIKDLF